MLWDVLLWCDMSFLATDSNTMLSTIVYSVAEDTWSRSGVKDACSCFLLALVVDVFDVEGVDVAWEVSEECQADVDEEIGAAASHEENANGRNEERYDD